MRRKLVFLTLVLVSVFLSVSSARACSCMAYDVPEAFEESGAIFVGQVTGTGGWINSYVDFKVEKSWKLVDYDEISLPVKGCDAMSFVVGERYLVYAHEYNGYLSTGSCTRTTILAKAEKDLDFLKDKKTIPITPKFFTKNLKIGLITTAFVLVFLGIGYLFIRFKKS